MEIKIGKWYIGYDPGYSPKRQIVRIVYKVKKNTWEDDRGLVYYTRELTNIPPLYKALKGID